MLMLQGAGQGTDRVVVPPGEPSTQGPRLGPLEDEEVIISTISPFEGILSIGTIIPLILAPTILLPTAVWIS